MEKVYLVVSKNFRGDLTILNICKTMPGALSKMREHTEGDPEWTSRFDGTIWNKGDQCMTVTERELEG